MAKLNVYTSKRPYSVTLQTKTFEDKLQPGDTATVSMRGLAPDEQFLAVDIALEMLAMYTEEDGPKLPAIDGQIPKLSKSLAQMVAPLVLAQEGPEEDRYTFEEFIGMSITHPNIFSQIVEWQSGLMVANAPKSQTSGQPPQD